MAVRNTREFDALTPASVAALSAHMGVFELAGDGGEVVRIGMAGGRSRFGLRSEIGACLESTSATRFRIEVTTAYMTRYQEMLMTHVADFGRLPAENDDAELAGLGRLSPGRGGNHGS